MSMRLSLCIATFKRGAFIGETLSSIVGQIRDGVEIVIVDGASPDNTQAVVESYTSRYPFIRYFREEQNSGVDADYDKAVGYANGEYCWLICDDDLLTPTAVDRVLQALDEEAFDLLVVDAEARDITLTETIIPSLLSFKGARTYSHHDFNKLLSDTGTALTYIGLTVIRRGVWLSRQRESYFGSLFIHVGVIFQLPVLSSAKVLAELASP